MTPRKAFARSWRNGNRFGGTNEKKDAEAGKRGDAAKSPCLCASMSPRLVCGAVRRKLGNPIRAFIASANSTTPSRSFEGFQREYYRRRSPPGGKGNRRNVH